MSSDSMAGPVVDLSPRQHRCICCNGEIDIPPDQDVSPGLSLRLGLVSDEYALICDGCAAHLTAARDAQMPPARGRRKSPGAASK
jgi:hypothetical protein